MISTKEKLLATPAREHWDRIGISHHHGIAVPLFSLHSRSSCGIGEYPDLFALIEFCKQVGMDMIQLLPLNDMGQETSPYSNISSIALNPLNIGMQHLPFIEAVPSYKEKIMAMQSLTSLPFVNYTEVRKLKIALLHDYFLHTFEEISKTAAYQDFIQNHHWLKSYALFKAIKENGHPSPWESWPLQYRSPNAKGFKQLLSTFHKEIDYHQYTQFLCFSQLKEVKAKATQEGIFLKGDIPILISRDSADVWASRNFFLLHLAAGAPPDAYVAEGQYWGFPVYDWEALEKENNSFWKERLKVASELYHLYRLDHVVGFFRLFTIPLNHQPEDGRFLPADESLWIPHGEKILKMLLENSPLLPVGEDLGTVPTSAKLALSKLGIPGTKLMRWERRWDEDEGFIDPKEYDPISMTTVSTHDSDTLDLWWRHYPKEVKAFCQFKGWDYKPFLTAAARQEILRDAHHSSSLLHINLLQEYLALFPELVAQNPMLERINIPGKILPTNWSYRVRPSLEELLAHEPLKNALKSIIH